MLPVQNALHRGQSLTNQPLILRSGRQLFSNHNNYHSGGISLRSGRALASPITRNTASPLNTVEPYNHSNDPTPMASEGVSIRTPYEMKTSFIEKAQAHTAQPNPEILAEIGRLISNYFLPNSNQINPAHFSPHPWNQADFIDESVATVLQTAAKVIASAALSDNIQLNIQTALNRLGTGISLNEPVMLYVYDTETNRLFGDALSVGWASIKFDEDLHVTYEEGQSLLPPNFVSYGAERIHKMTPDWLHSQQISGETTPPESVLLDWFTRVLESESAAGFNVRFDLTVMKRLAHRIGLPSEKVESLFQAIGHHYSLDAQDFLLRIDHQTRYDHQLPFQTTNRFIEIANKQYNNVYDNGEPIQFHPNKQLATYAKEFLGMNTNAAHDAQYDSRMTLATLLCAVGLRNEILDNEATFTRQSDKRLSTYERVIEPDEILSRQLYPQKSSSGTIITDRSRYNRNLPILDSLDDECIHNPMLKATPFIFLPTGITTHRRHIIPKSTIAQWLCNGSLTDQNTQFNEILNHMLFEEIAEVRLSPNAMRLCQLYRDHCDWAEIPNPLPDIIIQASANLLSSFEKSDKKNLSIRYFERPPAKGFLDNLPSSQSLRNFLQRDNNSRDMIENPLSINSLNQIMQAILYSFFHSLEFNQFIGNGAENLVAGMLFHRFSTVEATTLQSLDSATSFTELKSIITNWLTQTKDSLLYNSNSETLPDNDIFRVFSDAVDMTEPSISDVYIDFKRCPQEYILYFLEIEQRLKELFGAFFEYVPPNPMDSQFCSHQKLDSIINATKFFSSIVNYMKSKNAYTFSDRSWISPMMNSELIQHPDTIYRANGTVRQTAAEEFYERLEQVKLQCKASELYTGDQEKLLALIDLLFYEHQLHPNLLALETRDSGSLSEYIAPKSNEDATNNRAISLEESKQSLKKFVTSLYDSTAYDLPSNSAHALQNAHLLPIFHEHLNRATDEDTQSTQSLIELMEADHAMGESLNVPRDRDNERPLYNPMINYLLS